MPNLTKFFANLLSTNKPYFLFFENKKHRKNYTNERS